MATKAQNKAKKSSGSTSTRRIPARTSAKTSAAASASEENKFVEVLKDLSANPAVRFVAGGIATTIFTKFVTTLSTNYPEITNVIKDGLDSVEDKLNEFKNSIGEDDNSQDVHTH